MALISQPLGQGRGNLGHSSFLVLGINKLILYSTMVVLAVNLTTQTLCLNMTGKILSLKLLSTVIRTVNNFQLTFSPMPLHVFTRNSYNNTLVWTRYRISGTLLLVLSLNKLMFSYLMTILTASLPHDKGTLFQHD